LDNNHSKAVELLSNKSFISALVKTLSVFLFKISIILSAALSSIIMFLSNVSVAIISTPF